MGTVVAGVIVQSRLGGRFADYIMMMIPQLGYCTGLRSILVWGFDLGIRIAMAADEGGVYILCAAFS